MKAEEHERIKIQERGQGHKYMYQWKAELLCLLYVHVVIHENFPMVVSNLWVGPTSIKIGNVAVLEY